MTLYYAIRDEIEKCDKLSDHVLLFLETLSQLKKPEWEGPGKPASQLGSSRDKTKLAVLSNKFSQPKYY